MKACPFCPAQSPDESLYCIGCGNHLPTTGPTRPLLDDVGYTVVGISGATAVEVDHGGVYRWNGESWDLLLPFGVRSVAYYFQGTWVALKREEQDDSRETA